MALILGTAGTDLIKQFAGQAAGGPARNAYWGEVVTGEPAERRVQSARRPHPAALHPRLRDHAGLGAIGRAIPFGIGAVIGGAGNHLLGRSIVQSARTRSARRRSRSRSSLNPVIRAPKPPKAPKAPKAPKQVRASKPPKAPKRASSPSATRAGTSSER